MGSENIFDTVTLPAPFPIPAFLITVIPLLSRLIYIALMRKRIAIGLLAVALIGVAIFFVSQRNSGSVEWHRQRYADLLTCNTWSDRLRQMWGNFTGRRQFASTSSERAYAALKHHERALVKLGYFEERRFLVFNRSAEGVMMRAIGSWKDTQSNAIVRPHLDSMFIVGANPGAIGSVRSIDRKSAGELAESLVIVTQPEHMPVWADFVQRSDPQRPSISNLVHKSTFIPLRK